MAKNKKTKNLRKYFVSLALKLPCNFEVKVDAASEKEALNKALYNWTHEYDEKYITDPDWVNLELDINYRRPYALESGIHIEEMDR